MNNLRLRHVLLLALLLFTARLGWSQGTTTAAMTGTITDKTGTGLPGATVIAVHTPTNTQYVAPTNSEGRFNIQNMRIGGPYTVKVTFVGFQDVNRNDIFLTVGQSERVDVKLTDSSTQLGEVVVSGRQDPVINAGRTGAATTIQREQIERLPTLNRSFADFTRLTPQANGLGFGGRSGAFNNFTVDGAIFNNAFGLSSTVGGQAGAQPISIDAIEQIQVSIAPFDVRQGSFTGAGINAVTRSGTNRFTGSAYFFNRNESKYFLGREVGSQEATITDFVLRNFGGRIGGPIIKDKLFFFVSGERERRSDPPSGNFLASNDNLPANGTSVSQVSEGQLNTLSTFLQGRAPLIDATGRPLPDFGGVRNTDGSLANYNAGPYQGFSQRQNSDKLTVKLDWNINANHRFNVKYNLLRSLADVPPSNSGSLTNAGATGRQGTAFGLPFLAAYYEINNNLDSYIAELNSSFGARFSNNMTAGYTAFRDSRATTSSPFPFVEIGNGVGITGVTGTQAPNATLTVFGYEPFTGNNLLNTDVYQFGDNFTAYLGKHNVTVGTYNEYYKFRNGFAPNLNSFYRFNSLDDFYSNTGFAYNRTGNTLTPLGATAARANPTQFQNQFAANATGEFPFAEIQAAQFGLYIQDEYSPLPNLRLTAGLRGDLPIVNSDVAQNTNAAALTFRDGERINTGALPKRAVLFSPRLGFNWDVNNDKLTQMRGGTGIFTGRVPFVWLSNQASNNGILFGSNFANNATTGITTTFNRFNPNPQYFVPGNPNGYQPNVQATSNTAYNLAVTASDFKYPQVWRTNLAVDQQLPGGIVATLEGFYTKDVNAVYHQNVNLPGSVEGPINRSGGSDQRPIFYTFGAPQTGTGAGLVTTTANNRIYGFIPAPNPNPTNLLNGNTLARPNISDAIVMRNTSKGYSYAVTGQLQKTFGNGLFASLAYTYTDAKSVNDGGSIAQSIWRDRQVSGDPNAEALSYSSFMQRHRVIAVASYRREFIGHLATSLSVFYTGAPAGRFSYVYNGDMNGDAQTGNDLMFVPRNRQDIVLRDITIAAAQGGGVFTADQQYAALDDYINQDSYLKNRRGDYAERNGAEFPWLHQIDLKLIQDLFQDLGGNRNTLQLSLDVFNFGNLLNSGWGNLQSTNRSNPLSFAGYTTDGRPAFTFPYLVDQRIVTPAVPVTPTTPAIPAVLAPGQTLGQTFRDNVGSLSSRWQAQVGIRYIFN